MRESKTIIRICICSVIGAVLVIAQSFALNGLPTEYTELEYIQSSGTQYINTGVITNLANSYHIEANILNSGYSRKVICGSFGNSESGGVLSTLSLEVTASSEIRAYAVTTGVRTTTPSSIITSAQLTNTKLNTQLDWDATTKVLTVISGESTVNGTYSIAAGGDTNDFRLFLDHRLNTSAIANGLTMYDCKISVNGTLVRHFIPAQRNSDNVLGMYDIVTETFYGNSGTGSFTAGPEAPKITVATTKYVESKFSPISTELNTTISTIEKVVENTIKQSDRISALHTGKQNRPDDYNASEKCPDGYNCLLISDENGVPHWWPIITGDTSSGGDNTGGGSSSTFDASAFIAGISTTGAWGDKIYYRYDRSAGVATVMDTSTGNETGTTIQLSAGEWRVKKNDYGMIYGTSACNSNSGSEWWDNGIVTKSTSETDSGGGNCWCKMTGLAGIDGTKHDVSVGSWVFSNGHGYAAYCAYCCAYGCADNVRYDSAFRGAVLGGGD